METWLWLIVNTWLAIIVLSTALYIYFVPSLLAKTRYHRSSTAIFLLNTFLGWTFLGWVAALIWAAMKSEHRPAQAGISN